MNRLQRRFLILMHYLGLLVFTLLFFPNLWSDAGVLAIVLIAAAISGVSAFLLRQGSEKRGRGNRFNSLQWLLGVALDERERLARDQAMRITFVVAAVLATASFVLLGILFNRVDLAQKAIAPLLCLQWLILTVMLTLPMAIVEWNEWDHVPEESV